MNWFLKSMVAGAFLFASIVTSNATVVQFSDRITFNNSISITQEIDFNSLVGFQQPNSLVFGDASFISTNNSGLFNSSGFGLPGNYLASQNSGGAIQIDIAPGVSAIGLDVARLLASGASFSFGLRVGSLSIFTSGIFNVGNAFTFLGFTSDAGDISQLNITNISGSGFEAIDDVTLGTIDSLSVVPVPAALPLFGTGLAVMGFIGWRRKSKLAAAT